MDGVLLGHRDGGADAGQVGNANRTGAKAEGIRHHASNELLVATNFIRKGDVCWSELNSRTKVEVIEVERFPLEKVTALLVVVAAPEHRVSVKKSNNSLKNLLEPLLDAVDTVDDTVGDFDTILDHASVNLEGAALICVVASHKVIIEIALLLLLLIVVIVEEADNALDAIVDVLANAERVLDSAEGDGTGVVIPGHEILLHGAREKLNELLPLLLLVIVDEVGDTLDAVVDTLANAEGILQGAENRRARFVIPSNEFLFNRTSEELFEGALLVLVASGRSPSVYIL